MNNISGKLRNRVELWDKVEKTNELNELDYIYEKVGKLWAMITPIRGSSKTMAGDVEYTNITHKMVIRAIGLSIKNDMYITYRGQRYDIEYCMPHYQRRDIIELYCTLRIEGDADYG